MTYEELLIDIDLNGYENVLPFIGKTCFGDGHWFVVCDDGDCHLFDRYGKEDDIKKVKAIYEDMIPTDIKKIIIPNGIIYIGGWAFYKCNRLNSIMIPNSVTDIGYRAFRHCSNLKSITIPNSVMYIGDGAFSSCSGLKSVTIGNSVIRIGIFAFSGCTNLTSIIIDKPIDQVKIMKNYPWEIEDESIIRCER